MSYYKDQIQFEILWKVECEKNKELQEENAKLKNNIDAVLTYCQPHTELMWSAYVISLLLDCDFRDSREEVNKYLENRSQNTL